MNDNDYVRCHICNRDIHMTSFYEHLSTHRQNQLISLTTSLLQTYHDINSSNLTETTNFQPLSHFFELYNTRASENTNENNSNDNSFQMSAWYSYMSPQTQHFPTLSNISLNNRQTEVHSRNSPFTRLHTISSIAYDILQSIDDNLFFNDYERNIRLAEHLGVVEVGIDNIDSVSQLIDKKDLTDETCTICLEAMSDKEEAIRKLACGHLYCNSCITEWLAKSKKCPVCNIDLEEKYLK